MKTLELPTSRRKIENKNYKCTSALNKFPVDYFFLRFFCNFAVGLGLLCPKTYEKKKKRYAHQVFGNVGNFQIAYSDGIVVLTL